MIPLLDLKAQYEALASELDEAMRSVAASGHYILGPNVKALEEEVAAYCECKYGVGVANGTDALHLALRALRIGPGDEVITTAFTFIATTEAIGMVGAKPVFVDIDPATYNLDPNLIEAAITPRTRVILPVHLYGLPCDMMPILEIARRNGLRVVEDCAQAMGATYHGKKVGSFGDVGCLSFFPSKNLGCFGDGGMVVTNDEEIAVRVEMLRRHGGRVKYHHEELGLNSRLDELQAAILRVKLPRLDGWIAARRAIADAYNRGLASLSDVVLPSEPADHRAAYHQYTVRVPDRDELQRRLREGGVQTMVYYPVPLHLQEVHSDLEYRAGDLPVAEGAANGVLSLPLFPEMTGEQRESVLAVIRNLTK
jgi:dTDP-4-amino-4,6-dideoxygalactose transaminase